jgi:hypothetical protein
MEEYFASVIAEDRDREKVVGEAGQGVGQPSIGGQFTEEEVDRMCGTHFVTIGLDYGDAFGAGHRGSFSRWCD